MNKTKIEEKSFSKEYLFEEFDLVFCFFFLKRLESGIKNEPRIYKMKEVKIFNFIYYTITTYKTGKQKRKTKIPKKYTQSIRNANKKN